MKFTRTVLAVSALALSLSAYAADITGKWTGKLDVDAKAMEAQIAAQMKGMTPEKRKQAEPFIAMAMQAIKNMKVTLQVNKDGTFTSTTVGAPGAKGPQTDKGRWTLKGNQLTMTGDKKDKGPNSLVGTVSSNGKTIVFDMTKIAKASAGANASKVPSTKMIYTKN